MFTSQTASRATLVVLALLTPGAAFGQIGSYPAVVPDPVVEQRSALLDAATALQAIDVAGGFVHVPEGPALHEGDRGLTVSLLDQRLRQSGDLVAVREDTTLFDPTLEEAVKAFQRRHGLEDDGVVGPQTLARVNETASDLIARIEVNLARLDRMPTNWIGRRVVVNLPGYELTAYRDGTPELTMGVIVGRESRQTPEMESPITELVVNPTWTVPPTIMRQDIAPHMMNDPGYMSRRGLSLVSGGYRAYDGGVYVDWGAVRGGYQSVGLRQAAGPHNPLGRIKFNMQNDQMIYLHDTNERHLFQRARRALSSGCVRVSDPMTLATFVAEGVGDPWRSWTEDGAWRTRWVPLPAPVMVDIVYHTIWVDSAGVLQVREDVYGRDRQDIVAWTSENGAG